MPVHKHWTEREWPNGIPSPRELESRMGRIVGSASDGLIEMERAIDEAANVSQCLIISRHAENIIALAERTSRKALAKAETL